MRGSVHILNVSTSVCFCLAAWAGDGGWRLCVEPKKKGAFEFQNKYIISEERHNTPSTDMYVVVLNSFDINNNNISNKYSNKANIALRLLRNISQVIWFYSC